MPREIIIGNGNMLATFDIHMQMRDFYYPYVGMEDHTMYEHTHKVGIFREGIGIRWFEDPSWEIDPQYREETLVTNTKMINKELQLEIILEDYVHPVFNILVRNFNITTTDNKDAIVKIFMNHDFHIYGDKQKDTAFYEPYTNTVIHYRQNRYFLIGGNSNNPTECISGTQGGKYDSILKTMKHLKTCGISSYTVGKTGYKGLEGTWRDAEDGQLDKNPIEQGSVDSTVGIYNVVKANESTSACMWICAGKSLNEALELHQVVVKETPNRLERNCRNYWKSWVNKSNQEFGSLSKKQIDLYKRSLLLIRLHCDNRGGIIAAADADIMEFNKDTYTYIWPRDGAFVSLALDDAGFSEATRRFFEFCSDIQMSDGYMLHKYNPDGSPGSSWHPWFKDGEPQLPIQEDETALVLYALLKHFEHMHDFEFLQHMYEAFIKKAAQFLVDFTEDDGSLPLPSYDLWEEQRGVFTYTTVCTIAGLEAAAKMTHILGHYKHSERYQHAADTMRQGMFFHLYDEDTGRFYKKIIRKDGVTTEVDRTADISLSVLWKLGVLPIDDPRVVSTMKQLEEILTIQTDVGGVARYQNDYYHAVVEYSKEVPGNPWVLTTLWLAQWKIATAQTLEQLHEVKEVFDWTISKATSGGILPEQVDPISGKPLSVAPLTWSHATYVETIIQFTKKEKELFMSQ